MYQVPGAVGTVRTIEPQPLMILISSFAAILVLLLDMQALLLAVTGSCSKLGRETQEGRESVEECMLDPSHQALSL
jgi:hypothetical protein